MRFDRGYVSPYFVTDEKKQKIEFENCYILTVEKKLSTIQEILPYLEHTNKQQKPLLIIAEDVVTQRMLDMFKRKTDP